MRQLRSFGLLAIVVCSVIANVRRRVPSGECRRHRRSRRCLLVRRGLWYVPRRPVRESNTGAISGATWTTGGKNGGALSFDGTNDLVSVADSASLDLTTGMTIEAWVKPAKLGSLWRTVVVKEQPNQLSYALYAHTTQTGPSGHAFVGGGDRSAMVPSRVPVNVWTHLAVTYDGSTITTFVNGAFAASKAVSGPIAVSNRPLQLGGNYVWSEWFSGLLDDVRIYKRALSGNEVPNGHGYRRRGKHCFADGGFPGTVCPRISESNRGDQLCGVHLLVHRDGQCWRWRATACTATARTFQAPRRPATRTPTWSVGRRMCLRLMRMTLLGIGRGRRR